MLCDNTVIHIYVSANFIVDGCLSTDTYRPATHQQVVKIDPEFEKKP